MFKSSRNIATCGLVLSIMAGCASSALNRITGDAELPKELPQELHDRFEVKEVDEYKPIGTVDPVPVPPAALTPTVEKKTKGKKKAESTAQPAAGNAAPALSPPAAPPAASKNANLFTYPNRRPAKDPIWLGEKHTLEITYFGVAAGDFTVEVMPNKIINNRKVYYVRGTAISSKVFSLFYRLNDTIETFFDYDGLFSHRFHIVLDETKQARDSLELYDSEKAQTFYWNRWNHKTRGYTETKEFQPITRFPQDSLSALYYLRTVPLPTGAVFSVPVVSEGKNWEGQVTVVRREKIDTPLGNVQAVVLKPEAKYQGILQKRGDSYLWLSDDDRRVVLRLEAKVKIGTVVAALKKFEPGTPPEGQSANSK